MSRVVPTIVYVHKIPARLAVALLLVLVVAGCREEEPVVEDLRAVRTVIAAPGGADHTFSQTGEIVPRREVTLSFRVPGRLIAREAELGQNVEEGQQLARLDPRDLEQTISMARAERSAAEAAEIAAESHLERQRSLAERGIVARAVLDAAEADYRSAVGRRQSADAQLQSATNQREYAVLSAPVAGVVTDIGAQAGEVVQAGQPVLRLAAEGEREAAFTISERDAAEAVAGEPVDVFLVSDPQIRAQGTVREISPVADQVTRTYRVLVQLSDPPPAMLFGATVRGEVRWGDPTLIMLPSSSLTSQDGEAAVFVVNPDENMLERKPVEVARYNEESIYIGSGLEAGDIVVTAGVSKLRPGQAVKVDEGEK